MTAAATVTSPIRAADVLRGTGAERVGGPGWSEQLGLMLVDVAAMAFAGLLAMTIQWFLAAPPGSGFLYLWSGPRAITRLIIYGSLLLTALAWFRMLGHYTRRRPYWDEVQEVVKGVAVLGLLDATLMYSGQLAFSRVFWLGIWLAVVTCIPLFRALWKRRLIRLGQWQRPTLVLGFGPNAIEAAEALNSEPLMGFEVMAFAGLPGETSAPSHVISGGRPFPVVRLANPVDDLTPFPALNLVVALERGELGSSLPFLNRLQRHIADISVVPALKGLPLYGLEPNHFFRHEALFLRLRNNLGRRGPQLVKRLFDVIGSATLLVLCSPLFIYLALHISRDGGPVWFNHPRIGRHGRVFQCHKFRTMVPDATARLAALLADDASARQEWERGHKLRNDPRITPFGAFLRRSSLDELPQLWNVLKGEMSLVGPRPVVAAELDRYGDDAEYYLECRPGITGLWQISGRSDADYGVRVNLDTWYVRNWSLWSDIVILLKTVRVVLSRAGAY